MEHHREQASSYLTDASFSQQAKLLSFQPASEEGLLCSEPNGCQLDHARASREAPSGQKRSSKPTQTLEQKRKKKNEADRIYRKKHKTEFDKLKVIASRFGGVEKMEHEINAMEAELQRLWGIEQEYHVLRPMVTEVHRLEQMKYKFGGIEEMVTEINRLKNIEFQCIKYAQMDSRLNHQNAQSFFVQEQDYHGMQSVNFKNQEQGFETEIDRVWSHRDAALIVERG